MQRAVADLRFPLSGSAPPKVQHVQVMQREFRHDMARVRVNREQPAFPDYRSNTPVELTYGREGAVETFYGYVHHVEPYVERNIEYLTVVCIGTGYPLKQRRQQMYRDVTITDVVRTVAARHKLDADIEPHTQQHSVIVQSGESDWELLVRLAKQIGYVVYINGTQIRFHTRTRDLKGARNEAPRFKYSPPEQTDQGEVRRFASRIGETLPMAGRRADRRAYGVDPRTATIIEVRNNGELTDVLGVETADPYFDYYEQGLVIHSPGDGEAELDGITEDNRFHISATAEVKGDVRVRQAMPVYFDQLPEDYGGYWFVHGVTHTIGNNEYMLDLELGRDSLQVAADLPAGRARRDLSSLPKQGRSRPTRKPGTVLRTPAGAPKRGKKVATTRTPVKGKGKVSSRKTTVKRTTQLTGQFGSTSTPQGEQILTVQPGLVTIPPRGARYPHPPRPVRSTVSRQLLTPIVQVGKPEALWQAAFASEPARPQPAVAPQSPGVERRLSARTLRGA